MTENANVAYSTMAKPTSRFHHGEYVNVDPWEDKAPTSRRPSSALRLVYSSSVVERSLHERALVRAFDIVASSLLLIPGIPIMILAAVLVRATSKGSVLFRSERHGQNGSTFQALKLRTMVTEQQQAAMLMNDKQSRDALSAEFKALDDPRVTAVGRIFRRLSLDEVPQLLNVLRGEMSLVGPRPKLILEAPRYGDAFDEIMVVKPGLTGNWQTSGRNNLPFDARIELDLAYVRGRSLRWDLKICCKTAVQMFRPRTHGAY